MKISKRNTRFFMPFGKFAGLTLEEILRSPSGPMYLLFEKGRLETIEDGKFTRTYREIKSFLTRKEVVEKINENIALIEEIFGQCKEEE